MTVDFNKRTNKYRSRHKEEPENKLGIVQIDEPLMNIFCAYALSENATIHKHGLSSLYSLLTMINDSYFDKNQTMIIKYHFCVKALDTKLHGIHDRDLVLSSVNQILDINPLISDARLIREISNDEVAYVEDTVGQFLNNMYLNQKIASWQELLTQYQSVDFRKKNGLVGKIRDAAAGMLTQFRRNDANRDSSDTLFRLSDMESGVADIHKYVTSPSFKLVTGMQGLNAMFGGGIERGNVYAFFGLPGEGKTVTLENLLYQIWRYNRGYQCQDKTKRPAIVLLTMENFVRQTVCALYHILTRGKNLKDCETAQEAIDEFKRNAFEYNPDNQNSIEIVIKFKPINSVTTDYLYKLVEDLEDEGYETICFLQDYVKRILPVINTGDPYQDLGNIINDFKTFATLKGLPFITASQLNRDAAKLIDEGRNANKADLIKKLGRGNIGESSRMDENLDGTFIITPEFDSDGNKYMGFKMTKHRYEISPGTPTSIYQPFYQDAFIALTEDVYETKPAYRESLMKDPEEIRKSFGDVERASINKTVKALEGLTSVTAGMMSPGISMRPPIKKETASPFEPKHSLVNNVQKKVVMFIEEKDRESVREKYGIVKVV